MLHRQLKLQIIVICITKRFLAVIVIFVENCIHEFTIQ
jgi:hypothetical protein